MARILLIENNGDILQCYRDILRESGHHVTIATNGQEGIVCIKHKPPFDLIITDHYMPFMCGVEFIAQVRLLVERNLRIMLLSAGGITAEHGRECGIVVLQKPITAEQLRKAVNEMLLN